MRIRHLPETLVNRIAAGEVIERPSAAVKELVENSIDAGAKSIEITIRDGGRSEIIISDDGSGMSREELSAATDRHATSKLDGEDLLNIRHLGFRGEALPSIGAVSRMTIKSRSKPDGENGWEIKVEGGRKSGPAPCAHPEGTQVEVRDLFYATPARLKFLKSERAEFSAIKDMVSRISMAFPETSFLLRHNGACILKLPATGDRNERLSAVMGRDFGENSMMIDEMYENIRISGFAGLPTCHRGNSLHQYMFVNGRPVRDKLLGGALRGAYADVMSRDRYPVAAMYIDLAADQVDVNVHPAKTEVRFRDPSLVRRLIVTSIKNALLEHGQKASGSVTEMALARLQKNGNYRAYSAAPPVQGNLAEAVHRYYAPAADIEPSSRQEAAEETAVTGKHPLGAPRAQLHGNYIISQTEEGMVIIDQHAAHERLTYEKLKQQYLSGNVPAQMLLAPEIIETGRERAGMLLGHSELFAKLGMEIEAFGTGAVAVRSVPGIMGASLNVKELINDLLDRLEDDGDADCLEEKINGVLSRMSCHGSVRSGRRMNAEEMNRLLRDMEKTQLTGQCNHGRPTYVKLKLSDIEKLFGRK